jgi:hypothetical protein
MKFVNNLLFPENKRDAKKIIKARKTELHKDDNGFIRIHKNSWTELVISNLYLKIKNVK